MYNIVEVAEELRNELNGEGVSYPMRIEDYIKLVVRAIKKFYVDINRPDEYDITLYTTNEDNEVCYTNDFKLDEETYIYYLAKIMYFNMAAAEQSGDKSKSYTTDALSVTNAKEGFASIQQILSDLERERLRVYHKMVRYTL
jgi:hypothetical protein